MSHFNEIINGDLPVLVDFSAEWCGPCKAMAPILKDLKSATGDKLKVLKVDVDQNQAFAASMQISGVPTLVLYKAGKIVWRQSGVVPLHSLKEIVNKYI